MANSAVVSPGDDILASQYNNLRIDVLDLSTGHDHDGSGSSKLADNVELKTKGGIWPHDLSGGYHSGGIESGDIDNGAVIEAKIGTGAVTVNKLGASAVALAKLKLSTGSYSQDIPSQTLGIPFATNKYAHQIEVKGESTDIVSGNKEIGQAQYNQYGYAVTTSWAAMKYAMYNTHGTSARFAYAQWSYHAASKQGIWGIWDTDQKKLICVLVEEDEGYCKLYPELKTDQILIKFKDIEKFLKKEHDPNIDKTKDKKEKDEKRQQKADAGYILEHTKVKFEDLEEIA